MGFRVKMQVGKRRVKEKEGGGSKGRVVRLEKKEGARRGKNGSKERPRGGKVARGGKRVF